MSERRVLCLADKSPLPDYTGSRRRIARTVAALGSRFDVALAFVGSPDADFDDLRSKLSVESVHRIPVQRNPSPLARRLLKRIRQPRPLHLVAADLGPGRDAIARLIEDLRPDLLWVSGPWIEPYLPAVLTVPLVVDLPHSERSTIDREISLVLRQPWKRRRQLAGSIKLLLDRGPRLSSERRALHRASLVTPCSSGDLDSFRLPTGAAVLIVPNGMDPAPSSFRRQPDPARLLLVGDLFYPPNQEAAELLVSDVIPRIQRACPSIQLDLVGLCPDSFRAALSSECCVVHGMVPDLAEFYERATMAVVPISSGSGTRTKVLEACGFRVPVVTTAMALEGLPLTPGIDISVAEDAAGLADHAIRLLADPDEATAMAERAFVVVNRDLTWSAATSNLVDHLVRRWPI